MTEAWFYVSEDAGDAAVHGLLARLIERALRSPRQLYIHARDAEQACRLSDWLWQGHRFLPHGLHGEDNAEQAVIIGHGGDPGDHHDILVNLDSQIPDHFSRFQRVVELVSGDEASRALSREKWTFYKHRGYPVARHELG